MCACIFQTLPGNVMTGKARGNAGATALLVCRDTNSSVSATTSTVGTPGLLA